jgi:hypothetical protein
MWPRFLLGQEEQEGLVMAGCTSQVGKHIALGDTHLGVTLSYGKSRTEHMIKKLF